MDRVERLAELGRERTACIVAFPDAYDVTLVLKNDARLDTIPELGKTPAVRALDVARIESLVVQRILGAHGDPLARLHARSTRGYRCGPERTGGRRGPPQSHQGAGCVR